MYLCNIVAAVLPVATEMPLNGRVVLQAAVLLVCAVDDTPVIGNEQEQTSVACVVCARPQYLHGSCLRFPTMPYNSIAYPRTRGTERKKLLTSQFTLSRRGTRTLHTCGWRQSQGRR